jgi:KDO transferase-3
MKAVVEDIFGMLRKLCFRLFKPRGYWHNRKYDPTFMMKTLDNGHFSFTLKDRPICTARPISELQAPAKTVCIIASGPSVKTITDTSQFHAQSCACVNGSYALAEQFGFVPDYYVVCDPVFVNCQKELFMRAIKGSKRFVTQHHLIHRAAQMGLDLTQANEIYVYDDLRRPFKQVKKPLSYFSQNPDHYLTHNTHNMAYSMSPALGLFSSSTVVYNAVQILFGSGVDSLYIFGMDLNSQKRFYETLRTAPTHIEESYEDRTLPSFELVSEFLKQYPDKRIWNCSPDSRLPAEIIPKLDPNEALARLGTPTK